MPHCIRCGPAGDVVGVGMVWEGAGLGPRCLSLLNLEAKWRGSPRYEMIIVKLSLIRVNRDAEVAWQRLLATSALPAGVVRTPPGLHLTHLNFITSSYFSFRYVIIWNIWGTTASKQLPLVTLRLRHSSLSLVCLVLYMYTLTSMSNILLCGISCPLFNKKIMRQKNIAEYVVNITCLVLFSFVFCFHLFQC